VVLRKFSWSLPNTWRLERLERLLTYDMSNSGVARFAGGAVAISVYTTILTNVQGTEAARIVPEAAIAAGLPASSVQALLAALPLGSAALSQVPGITAGIMAAAGAAFQQSYVVGLRTTALSSLSFGIIGIIGKFARNNSLPPSLDMAERRSSYFH
jgi:predicted secreted protein